VAKEEISPRERFRDALKDSIVLIEKLAPLCSNVEELVGLMRLAMSNDGQCTLLMKVVQQSVL
jgi:hypothetical protein